MTTNEILAYLIALGAGIIACLLALRLEHKGKENRNLRRMIYSKDVKNFILIQKIKEDDEKETKR